jgi:hypothetical protein
VHDSTVFPACQGENFWSGGIAKAGKSHNLQEMFMSALFLEFLAAFL